MCSLTWFNGKLRSSLSKLQEIKMASHPLTQHVVEAVLQAYVCVFVSLCLCVYSQQHSKKL